MFPRAAVRRKVSEGDSRFQRDGIRKVHDLLLLSDQCERAGIIVAVDPKQLNTLSDYAVRVRYPGDEPTIEEAREAVEIAGAMRRFARALLGIA